MVGNTNCGPNLLASQIITFARQLGVRMGVNDDVLMVQLLDNGLPAKDEDLRPRELHELRPGGLGVRFMRELMDGVAYRPAPEGYANCLQLTKRIS